ncbi:MAG: TatD family hydrolase [candidate division Zixibacteria bacterium]|nr:TatD family hydrolase [candidate division Zixibacteria bacterium]
MIDTHCHLDFPDYNNDREQVLADARATGVRRMVNIGCDLKSSDAGVELANCHAEIFAAIGFHPHDAKNYDDAAEQRLRELASNFKVVAIGEIGLDFYRDHSPRDIQRRVFVRQIALARELGLPLVIHIRNAYPEALDILIAEKAYESNVVLHCFSGTPAEARQAADYGMFLSVGGVLTFTNSRLPELVKVLPRDLLLLETDAPYLTPHPHRGQRNAPAMIKLVYEKLAAVWQQDFTVVESAIDANAERFFEFE